MDSKTYVGSAKNKEVKYNDSTFNVIEFSFNGNDIDKIENKINSSHERSATIQITDANPDSEWYEEGKKTMSIRNNVGKHQERGDQDSPIYFGNILQEKAERNEEDGSKTFLFDYISLNINSKDLDKLKKYMTPWEGKDGVIKYYVNGSIAKSKDGENMYSKINPYRYNMQEIDWITYEEFKKENESGFVFDGESEVKPEDLPF